MQNAIAVATQARSIVSADVLARELQVTRDQLQSARDRIEELEAEIGQKPDQVATLRRVFEISRQEAKLLAILLSRDLVTPAGYLTLVYGFGPDCDTPEEKIFDVRICKLRRAFRRLDLADPIETVWGQGKRIPPARKAALRELIARMAA